MEVLHKELSLRFTEQTDLSIYKPPHTSCLSCSCHIYSLMSVIQGLCMTKLSFHHILWNKNRLTYYCYLMLICQTLSQGLYACPVTKVLEDH